MLGSAVWARPRGFGNVAKRDQSAQVGGIAPPELPGAQRLVGRVAGKVGMRDGEPTTEK